MTITNSVEKLFHKNIQLLVLIIVTFFNVSAKAQEQDEIFQNIKEIQSSQSCYSNVHQNYESWLDYRSRKNQNFNKKQFNKNYPENLFNHYKESFPCYFFSYLVENEIVDGYLILPSANKNLEKSPVIVFNRGGSGTYGNINFNNMFSHIFYLAEEGVAVIGTQYRGGTIRSVQHGGQDEWGGKDVKDVEGLFTIIDQIKQMDSNRIGMFGVSRGSVNMFRTAKNTRRVKAIVSASGIYDMEHELEFRPSMEKIYKQFIPGYTNNKILELEKRSVVKWANQLDLSAPILLLHSSYDQRASATGALSFARILQNQQHRFSLILFEADDHFFSEHKNEVQRATIDWFKKYL